MIEVQKHLEGRAANGRYPLIEPLGSTPHSSVFRTQYDGSASRQAAIKLIPAPAAASEAQLTRWRLAARFSHPALLRIFDMGRCDLDGRPMLYVVMELAEENLADVLPVRPLSPDEASGMLAPVLEALAYLHSKGFVHGHLRPSNILAIGDQVKLSTDFIARIGENAETRDSLDPYRAPETILSAVSDVWSLGVTVIECLTRRVPERQSEEGNALTLPSSMPQPFAELSRHCLNPIPQRRWNVAQLQAALGLKFAISPAAAEPRSNATPPPQSAAASAFAKSNPLPAIRRRFSLKKRHGLILGGLIAATAVFVLGILISGSSSDSSPAAPARIATSAKAPLVSAPQQAIATPAKQPETAAFVAAKPKREPEKLRTEAERPDPQSTHSASSSLIISNVPSAVTPNPTAASAAGVVPGAVTRRALPRVPASASNSIWGTVRVSVVVDVDPRGHVVEAKLHSPGPSQYFARLSMAAAQDWKFAPPRVDGSIVPSEWLIDFGYSKSDTSATASEKHP